MACGSVNLKDFTKTNTPLERPGHELSIFLLLAHKRATFDVMRSDAVMHADFALSCPLAYNIARDNFEYSATLVLPDPFP